MAQHNKDTGFAIESKGLSCGSLALNANIPTLAHVEEVYGRATVVAWLMVQIDAADALNNAKGYGDAARSDAAKMIYAKYKEVNVANMLQFFARFKMGEFSEQTARSSGVEKLLLALKCYNMQREDDVRRLQRQAEIDAAYLQRLEWERKAITYDEYVRGKRAAVAEGNQDDNRAEVR